MFLIELFGLNDDEDVDSQDRKIFDAVVKSPKTVFCHESPSQWRSFMKGITDETTFATVGKASNFVSSNEKTRIWFKVPKRVAISPDMRYESYEQLVQEHPKIIGADVAINSKIPLSWILRIEEVKNGSTITQYSID